MKEPQRWLDDAGTSRRLRDVLGAASSAPELPSSVYTELSSFTSGLVAEGLLVKATASHWVGKAVLAKLASGGAAKALAVVSLMGAAGTASYVAVGHRLDKVSTSRAATSNTASRAAAGGAALPAAPAAVLPETESEVAVVVTDSAAAPSPRLPTNANGAALSREPFGIDPTRFRDVPQLGIADEARLLESARGSLASDPAYALSVVQHHQVRYPSGQLSAERELIAVDALLRLGRRIEAEQRAAPRLEQDPNSLYAKRLRQLLGRE